MVVDAAAACLWLDPEIQDPQEMLAHGFERMFSAKPIQIGGRERQRVVPGSAAGSLALAATAQPKLNVTDTARQEPRPPGHARRPMELCMPAFRRLARAALSGDKHAFAGYHRWQINDRWDVCLGRDGVAPYEKELRTLERSFKSLFSSDTSNHPGQAGSRAIPPPALAASLAFRLYLAQRDALCAGRRKRCSGCVDCSPIR